MRARLRFLHGTALTIAATVLVAQADAPQVQQPQRVATASAPEVWIGGSRAWPDLVAPASKAQWSFLQQHADGFYINNFALRLTDKSLKLDGTQAGRVDQLRAMRRLMKSPRAFYETDQQHATDDFERAVLAVFPQAGFDLAAVTINRGTNPARTALLTDNGKRSLYYMFGPWNGNGSINDEKNATLRAGILQASGAAVDGPVTMWRKDARQMKAMCYSTIQWCHAHGKKFLYLLAPNESGNDFLKESQKLAHDMEDNDANPDIWAVSFYGPQSFRDALETLPERQSDGSPAETFSGTAYWLIHHLRDPDHAARLSLPGQGGAADGKTIRLSLQKKQSFPIVLANHSSWLDLAPVLRARSLGAAPRGWTLRWKRGGQDVTDAIMGDGLVFHRDRRLLPGSREELRLEIERAGAADAAAAKAPVQSLTLRVELRAHPSQPAVHQSVNLEVTSGAKVSFSDGQSDEIAVGAEPCDSRIGAVSGLGGALVVRRGPPSNETIRIVSKSSRKGIR